MSSTERTFRNYQRLLESTIDYFGTLLPGDPRDIYGDVDGLQPIPPGGIPPYYRNNQGRGEVLPVYTTWLQLKYIRDRSRRLCMENEFAICAMENRRNYIVGDEFTFRATGEDEELVDNTQQILDAWSEAVELPEYIADAMERLDKDGEFFIRFFPCDNGLVDLRFIEPEHVKDMAGDVYSPARSFGIETDIDDVETVIGYHVIDKPWQSDTTSLVPAEEVIHVKLNVPRNAKRGLPTYYPVETNLRRAEDLLASMSSMAKTRAKVALIRTMLNVTQSAAQSMVNSLSAGIPLNDPVTGQTTNLERLKYGTILTSSGNIKYDMPGANTDAGSFVAILQAELRAVAARVQMPEWMLTVDASNANLASSLVAEAPSVKAFRRIQRMLCRAFGESRHPKRKSAAWRQVEYAIELGVLPREVLSEVSIQCEGPSLVVRNKAEEAEVNRIYYDMGIKSPQTIAQEQSLDFEQERQNRQQAGLDGAGKPPVAVGTPESLQEVIDDQGAAHGVPGTYTQDEFSTPPAGGLTPQQKKEFADKKAMGLRADADKALKAYRDDPSEGSKLTADKALAAYETAAGEQYQYTPGEIRPTEQELHDWLTTGPVGSVSAGRAMGEDITDAEVAERHEALKHDLNALGFQYTTISTANEPAFLVKLPADKKNALLMLGKRYGQDSVLHSQDGRNELIYTGGPHMGKANVGQGFSLKPDAEDGYSEYAGPNGPIKFSMNLDFGELHPMKEELVDPLDNISEVQAVDRFGKAIRELRNKSLPPLKSGYHDPKDVVSFNKKLDKYIKSISMSKWTLGSVLQDHSNPLHSFVGEAVVAAMHGGEHRGGPHESWDSIKGSIGHDNKMAAGTRRNYRQGVDSRNNIIKKAFKDNLFPVITSFNPGGSYQGKSNPVSIVASTRVKPFSHGTGDDDPDVTQLLHDPSGNINTGLLYSPSAVQAFQSNWNRLEYSIPKDIAAHNRAAVVGIGAGASNSPKEEESMRHQTGGFIAAQLEKAKAGDASAQAFLAALKITAG